MFYVVFRSFYVAFIFWKKKSAKLSKKISQQQLQLNSILNLTFFILKKCLEQRKSNFFVILSLLVLFLVFCLAHSFEKPDAFCRLVFVFPLYPCLCFFLLLISLFLVLFCFWFLMLLKFCVLLYYLTNLWEFLIIFCAEIN